MMKGKSLLSALVALIFQFIAVAQDYVGVWQTIPVEEGAGIVTRNVLRLAQDSTFVMGKSFFTGENTAIEYMSRGHYTIVNGHLLFEHREYAIYLRVGNEWYPCQDSYLFMGNGLDSRRLVVAAKGYVVVLPEETQIVVSEKDQLETTEWRMTRLETNGDSDGE